MGHRLLDLASLQLQFQKTLTSRVQEDSARLVEQRSKLRPLSLGNLAQAASDSVPRLRNSKPSHS